jgi:hypothetical protein
MWVSDVVPARAARPRVHRRIAVNWHLNPPGDLGRVADVDRHHFRGEVVEREDRRLAPRPGRRLRGRTVPSW